MVVRKLEMEFSFNPSQVKAEVNKLNRILKSDVGGTQNNITPKVNTSQVKSDISEIRDDINGFYARVNSREAVDISINKARFQVELKQLRRDLRDAEKRGDLDAQINIQSNINRVSQQVSQANRELRNFSRTGSRDVSVLGKALGNIRTSIGGFSASLRNLIPLLGAAFVATGVTFLSRQLFTLGSRLDETEAKFNTVFRGVDGVRESFNSIADAVGRSRLEIIEFGAGIGDVLIPLGFARDEAAELSQEIVKLGVDLASFNNISDERAINALRSALTGEREALKSLGIVINEADIQTAALNKGIITQGQELTKTQKALLTYQLFLANTADAQGDAVRTAGSFANQLKRLQGIITDTFASAGQEVSQETAGALQAIADFVSIYGAAYVQSFIQIAKGIGEGFRPIFEFIGTGINAITTALSSGREQTVTFGQVLLFVFASIGNGFRVLGAVLRQGIITVGALFGGLAAGVTGSFSIIVESVKLAGTAILDTFKSLPGIIGGNVARGINRAIRSINRFIEFANNIPGVNIGTIGLNLDESGAGGNFAATSAQFDSLRAAAAGVGDDLRGITADFGEATAANFSNLITGIQDSNSKIFSSVKSTEEAKQAQYDATFKSFDDLLKNQTAAQEDANAKGGASNKKATEETIKEAQERAKALEEAEARALKAIRDRVEESEELTKQLGDTIREESQESAKEVQGLVNEIGEIGKAFEEESDKILNDSTASIADRAVEIQDELRELDRDLRTQGIDGNRERRLDNLRTSSDELRDNFVDSDTFRGENVGDLIQELELLERRRDLQAELALANDNVSQSDIDNAESIAGESDIQRIIREREEGLSELRESSLEEIAILEEKINAEVAILERFADINKNIQERITADTIAELQKRGISSSDFSGQVSNALSNIQEQNRANVTNQAVNITIGDINNAAELDDVIDQIKEAIQ